MSMNWLEGMHPQMDEPGRPQAMAMPVFAGQKLVVVGGSSGMGRQTAEDVVAAGGSAVIIGEDASKVDDTVQALAKDGTAYGITADLTDRMQARAGLPATGRRARRRHPAGQRGRAVRPQAVPGPRRRRLRLLRRTEPGHLLPHPDRGPRHDRGGRGGSIVNIGSMWANQAIGATPSSAYSLAKGGLHALTRNLALELAPTRSG